MKKTELGRNKSAMCAREIIDFLIKHYMWIDTSIYINGKRYSCRDAEGHYHYANNWDCVFCEDDVDVKDFVEYNSDFLTMTFEGGFYDVINYNDNCKYCDKLMEEFDSICHKYGKYHELGYSWSLALYDI